MCACYRGRERWVNGRIRLPQRKDGLEQDRKAGSLCGSGSVNSAGVVYVKILEKVSGKRLGGREEVGDL